MRSHIKMNLLQHKLLIILLLFPSVSVFSQTQQESLAEFEPLEFYADTSVRCPGDPVYFTLKNGREGMPYCLVKDYKDPEEFAFPEQNGSNGLMVFITIWEGDYTLVEAYRQKRERAVNTEPWRVRQAELPRGDIEIKIQTVYRGQSAFIRISEPQPNIKYKILGIENIKNTDFLFEIPANYLRVGKNEFWIEAENQYGCKRLLEKPAIIIVKPETVPERGKEDFFLNSKQK